LGRLASSPSLGLTAKSAGKAVVTVKVGSKTVKKTITVK
jgi:hypothetical protein